MDNHRNHHYYFTKAQITKGEMMDWFLRESTFVISPEDKIKGLILVCFFLGLFVAMFFIVFRK